MFTVIPQGHFESNGRKTIVPTIVWLGFDPFRPVQNHTDHGVKRVRWSPHEQDTKEFDPNELSVQVSSKEHNRGLKRQPESTTEDLEDAGDQENRGDADDDDMKALGAVNEEPVITIGVSGETLDVCENGEESYVNDVSGGFLDPEMVREARVEELAGYLEMQVYCRVPVAEIGSHKVIKTRWVDTNKGDERSPEIRCRLVAKEVKKRNNTEEPCTARVTRRLRGNVSGQKC